MQTDDRVLIGFDGADDAAVVRLDGDRYLIQTVDFFTPIVDDPYLFGQIAASNSLSDVYAMGGEPLFALNIVGFPIKTLPKAMLTEILQGGADKAKEAGISIVGGHSIDDREPKYGLVVTGEVDKNHLIRNDGAKLGDVLILTKPLGTGIIATAIKKEKADQTIIDTAIQNMVTLNKAAAAIMNMLDIHAATDITGYGLLGHLAEMCNGSVLSAELNLTSIPVIKGVKELSEQGLVPGGTKRNLESCKKHTDFSESISEIEKYILADAQTSGGLLISLPEKDAISFINLLREREGIDSNIIGKMISRGEKAITVRK